MTILAFQAKEPGMDFWFCMALDTFHWRAGEPFFSMTGGAISHCMLTIQNKGIRMVEVVHPVNAVVALGAGIAKLLAVVADEFGIVLAVAGDAGRQIELPDIFNVTGGTSHRFVFVGCCMSNQAEPGVGCVIELLAIQPGGDPPCGSMAIPTGRGEDPQVGSRLRMARGAIVRHPRVTPIGIFRWIMTIHTKYLIMFALQRETGGIMIETLHPISAVVTGQAVVPNLLDVLLRKGRIMIGMTGFARLIGNREILLAVGMAGFTGNRGGVIIHLMPIQAEAGHRMIKVC